MPESEPLTPITPPVIELGVAGGSAQHEFARRHAQREDRIRTAHPKLGGLILALSDDPQSTTAWKSGAVGERKLGEKLAGLGETIIALHDRRVPKSRANLDHVVIGPAGVYVIDAKRHKNAKITVRRSGGILKPARTQLMVSGRDKTKLVEAMAWQVAAVRAALAASPEFADAAVIAALCFIDAEFPFFGTIEIGEVRVRGLGGTAKLVSAAGPFDAAARDRLARRLATQLPAK
ncbi:MAG: nuclease-related domain-containing protein [Jatrophihabitantaceae bacterium]